MRGRITIKMIQLVKKLVELTRRKPRVSLALFAVAYFLLLWRLRQRFQPKRKIAEPTSIPLVVPLTYIKLPEAASGPPPEIRGYLDLKHAVFLGGNMQEDKESQPGEAKWRTLYFKTDGKWMKLYKDSFATETMLVDRINLRKLTQIRVSRSQTDEALLLMTVSASTLSAPTLEEDRTICMRVRSEMQAQSWAELIEVRRKWLLALGSEDEDHQMPAGLGGADNCMDTCVDIHH
eukprot:gb/GEZN01018509.1/.p1 GENE.gb/GEZN01018509.1/~~gb/GEZN01018509.1/.p1  ORF type:complete len:234 (+),score=34.87 gb/GEZN01018509.1/:19-720(+)